MVEFHTWFSSFHYLPMGSPLLQHLVVVLPKWTRPVTWQFLVNERQNNGIPIDSEVVPTFPDLSLYQSVHGKNLPRKPNILARRSFCYHLLWQVAFLISKEKGGGDSKSSFSGIVWRKWVFMDW